MIKKTIALTLFLAFFATPVFAQDSSAASVSQSEWAFLVILILIAAFGSVLRTAVLAIRDSIPGSLLNGIVETLQQQNEQLFSALEQRALLTPNTLDELLVRYFKERVDSILQMPKETGTYEEDTKEITPLD